MADERDTTKLVDTSEVSAGLRKLVEAAPRSADRTLRETALGVLARAKALAPVDTGALRASGQAAWMGTQAAGRGGGAKLHEQGPEGGAPAFPLQPGPGEAYVAFTMEYAAAVHEDPDAHHDVGEAKFLEKALVEAGQELARKAAEELLKE